METAIVKSAHRNETSYEDVTEEIVDPETRALEKGPCSHIGKVFCCFPWVIAAEKVWENQALRKTSSSDSPISVTADEEKVTGKLQWQRRLPRYCEGFISCPPCLPSPLCCGDKTGIYSQSTPTVEIRGGFTKSPKI